MAEFEFLIVDLHFEAAGEAPPSGLRKGRVQRRASLLDITKPHHSKHSEAGSSAAAGEGEGFGSRIKRMISKHKLHKV